MDRPLVTTLVLGIVLSITVTASAADILRPRLVVRTYALTTIAAPDLERARHEATALLDLAGIEVAWISCDGEAPSAVPVRCGTPLKRDEVAVRLVRLPRAPAGREQSLGESLIDRQQGSGTLATIYVDRVEWLARAACADVPTLLGRALAHELGHLLLGTRDHSPSGLMRPLWTRDEVRRQAPRDWQFTRADASRLQEGLSRRVALANIVWATE